MAPKGSNANAKGKGNNANAKGKGKGKAKDTSNAGDDDSKKKSKPLKGAQSVNVRHILCEKQSRKDMALEKLKEGKKWNDVVTEFSEDKTRNGGALGWITRGTNLAEFEQVAFNLEASTISKPVYGEAKTIEGYHIIVVDGRK